MKRLLLLLLLAGIPLRGDGITDLGWACFQRDMLHHASYWLAECIQEAFSIQPVHLTVGTIEPGAGIFAYGLAPAFVARIGQFEFLTNGSAVRSTDGSYLVNESLTFALPLRGIRDVKQGTARFGSNSKWALPASKALDAKASLTLAGSRMEAKEQDFYGLGNETARSARSGYGLRLNDFGAAFNYPLLNWTSLSFGGDFLQPRVGLSSNTGIPQMRNDFDEATAPGLTTHSDFVRLGPSFNIQVPPQRSSYFVFAGAYQFYHSVDDEARYSFRRLNLSGQVIYHTRVQARRLPIFDASKPAVSATRMAKQKISASRWVREAVCLSERSGKNCTLGDLAFLTTLTYSFAGVNSQVPFYFQDTLGGANFENQDTLRGYADYRFRAPDLMLGQLEYRHPIWGPVGLLGFYDVGKVGMDASDLTFAHWHHDWGIGLYARIGNREIARVYLGFGTHEGTQIHPKLGSLY